MRGLEAGSLRSSDEDVTGGAQLQGPKGRRHISLGRPEEGPGSGPPTLRGPTARHKMLGSGCTATRKPQVSRHAL